MRFERQLTPIIIEEESTELSQPTPAPSLEPAQVCWEAENVAEQVPVGERLLRPVEIVDDLLDKIERAKRHLEQVERSWEKTRLTYSDYKAHPLFDCKSVMERDEERLLAADRQLGEARARLAWYRDIYTRHRTFFMLSERVLDRPTDRVLRAFHQRALRRVRMLPPVPEWESMWPGMCAGNIWDYNARAYGLCISRGLLHKDVM